jgi:hypothetical protein
VSSGSAGVLSASRYHQPAGMLRQIEVKRAGPGMWSGEPEVEEAHDAASDAPPQYQRHPGRCPVRVGTAARRPSQCSGSPAGRCRGCRGIRPVWLCRTGSAGVRRSSRDCGHAYALGLPGCWQCVRRTGTGVSLCPDARSALRSSHQPRCINHRGPEPMHRTAYPALSSSGTSRPPMYPEAPVTRQ